MMRDLPETTIEQLASERDYLDRLKDEFNDAQKAYDDLLESPEEKDASYQWFDIRDREFTECRIRICERIQALEKISTRPPSEKSRHSRKSWALSIYEKNPEISVVAKVEFPIGKKLFHLVVNPGTWRCPTVDLELVQTTRNVNGTRHSVRKFQSGKRDHLFRFFTFSGNFPVGRTNETCSIYRRTGNSGNFD